MSDLRPRRAVAQAPSYRTGAHTGAHRCSYHLHWPKQAS